MSYEHGACEQEAENLRAELADLQALFDLQWTRTQEADALWRAEAPDERALITPDLGTLLTWLMAGRAAAEQQRDAALRRPTPHELPESVAVAVELTREQIARHEWRYVWRGSVAHAFQGSDVGVTAVCGMSVWSATQWRGTGSQDEYETAAALPCCKRCARALTR